MDGIKMFFDGWMPITRTLVLGTLGYTALVFLLRVSGKRTLSKMNAFDFVITVAFGSALASMLTSKQVSLLQGVLALALLVLLQYINTFLSVRIDWYRRMIKSQPTLLYFDGNFLADALRKQRVTQEEVIAAMRQQGFTEPSEVDAVVIETEGSLSVLGKNAASAEALERVGVDANGQI